MPTAGRGQESYEELLKSPIALGFADELPAAPGGIGGNAVFGEIDEEYGQGFSPEPSYGSEGPDLRLRPEPNRARRMFGRGGPGQFLGEEAAGTLADWPESGSAKTLFAPAKGTANPTGAVLLEPGIWPNLPGDGLLIWTKPDLQFWVPQRFDFGGNRTGGTKSSWTLYIKPVWGTDGPRLKQSTQFSGRLTEVNGVRSANEWIFTSNTDYRFEASRWLMFGKVAEEYDEIEKLSLRSTSTAGLGYRIQSTIPNRYLILRLGPTITFERYYSPDRDEWTPEALMEAELKYAYQRITFEHRTSAFHSLTDSDVRLQSDAGMLLPLDQRSLWSFRLGFRHNYNDRVGDGVRPWDYEASFSIVFQRNPTVAGSSTKTTQ